ncbi:MAG: DUF3048 domain-containing protein [Chloroflexales bacterium]|nr:DUF3048 domain-containing protein [Chloroflexales bacterium]
MKFRFWLQQILAASFVLTMLVACGGAANSTVPTAEIASAATVTPAAPEATATPQPTLEPTVVPTPTNIPLPADLKVVPLVRGEVTKRPFMMMIDNHPDAYPQSGLNRASVVFEALAEYGITRFMAIFPGELTDDDRRLGPVRSARSYFVQWAMGFGAFYAHAGGSPTGLELAESTDQIVNLDALRNESADYFFRVETDTRVAPHNLYSNGTLLQARAAAETVPFTRSDVGFRYRLALEESKRGVAQTFSYFFLYDDAPVGWNYDPASNDYNRTRFGKAAKDEVSQNQLTTQNVVVIQVIEAPIAGDPKSRIDQQVVGSGKGILYRDGLRQEITWNKASPETPLIFLDSNGQEVLFTAGQIWISAVPDLANITES